MRDRQGKFLPGHSGGPGRPARPLEQRYLDAVRQAVTVADLICVFRTAVALAKAGDMPAAKFVASYTLGLPVDTVLESRIAELERIAHGLTADRQT